MSQDERRKLRKKLEEMEEMEEEEHSPLISVMPNLACKMSPSKADDQTTQDNTETNHNEGVYEAMMLRKKAVNNKSKYQRTFTKLSSARLLSIMAHE